MSDRIEAPFTDGLVGESNTTHRHELFDIAKAQSEAEVEPHSVANDFGREAVAAIERRGCVHQRSMPQGQVCGTLGSLS